MLRITRKGKSALHWDKVQESNTRTAFGTGSQRDTQDGKGRYDLIPTSMLHRLAVHYENGAAKYGDNNWQKGQPLAQYYNSAIRHLQSIRDADLSEDHFAAAIWNVAAMIHHIDKMLENNLPVELDSFGIIQKIKEYETFEQLRQYTGGNTSYLSGSGEVKYMLSGAMPDAETSQAIRDRLEETYGKSYTYKAAEYRISELGKKRELDNDH